MKILYYIFLCLIIVIILMIRVPLEFVYFENKTDYIGYLKKYYNNDDIVGELRVGKLNEVLVRSNDNDYYLNHNLYKETDYHGSVFIDYRNDLDDKIVLVYGHNSMYGDTPFSYLENYYDEYFLNDNNIITLCGSDFCFNYVIFSVFVETDDWFYMNIEGDFSNYLDKLMKKSWFDRNIKVVNDDSIVLLQTCSYHSKYKDFSKKYLIIAAKRI